MLSKTMQSIISNSHDYIVVFTKDIECFQIGKLERTEEANNRYKNPDNDPRGDWTSGDLTVKTYSPAYDYEIKTLGGRIVRPTDGRCWFTNKKRMQELIEDNRIWFGADGNNMPRLKRFLSELNDGMVPISIWYNKEVGHNQEGRQELKKLFDDKGYFDGPKPVRLLKKILTVANLKNNDIILDFFSGSATTAHAVMQLNAEDGGKRKFIMVQLPEACDENSEAYKAGYRNISEIGKERIRRAGEKIKEDNKEKEGIENLDIGFKVFKVGDTNIRWFSEAIKSDAIELDKAMMSNKDKLDFNPGYTDIDVVYEILLRHRDIPLSATIEHLKDIGPRTYMLADTICVCLDEKIDSEMIDKIAAIDPMPTKIIFRDSAFEADISLKENTMIRLQAQIKKQSGVEKKAYRIEFI